MLKISLREALREAHLLCGVEGCDEPRVNDARFNGIANVCEAHDTQHDAHADDVLLGKLLKAWLSGRPDRVALRKELRRREWAFKCREPGCKRLATHGPRKSVQRCADHARPGDNLLDTNRRLEPQARGFTALWHLLEQTGGAVVADAIEG